MKVKLSRPAELGGRTVRVVRFRELSMADLKLMTEISATSAADPDGAASAMISVATGLPAGDLLLLPIDDFASLMEAVADLSAAAADRLERIAPRMRSPMGGMH